MAKERKSLSEICESDPMTSPTAKPRAKKQGMTSSSNVKKGK